MLRNRGFIHYEILISLIIITVIVNFTLVYLSKLERTAEDLRMEYRMKQSFYLNLKRYENHEPFVLADDYTLYMKEGALCMDWTDLYGKNETYCENFRV